MCLGPLMVLTFTDKTAQAGSSTGMSLGTIRNRGVEQHGEDRPTQVPARTVRIHRAAIVHKLVHRRLPALTIVGLSKMEIIITLFTLAQQFSC
jgi:hypothetical protein